MRVCLVNLSKTASMWQPSPKPWVRLKNGEETVEEDGRMFEAGCRDGFSAAASTCL